MLGLQCDAVGVLCFCRCLYAFVVFSLVPVDMYVCWSACSLSSMSVVAILGTLVHLICLYLGTAGAMGCWSFALHTCAFGSVVSWDCQYRGSLYFDVFWEHWYLDLFAS